MAHISIVIPVYKAEDCLHELYHRLRGSLETLTSDFEILLVEDCGGDRSWEIIVELSRKDPRVRGLQFSRNFGQHYGISAGLDNCNGDWVVVMDCDLQDRPEEIPHLYRKAQEGYDVVLAKRTGRQDKALKKWTSTLFYKAFNYLSGMKYDGDVGNFRIVSRKVVDTFRLMRENLRFFGGLVHWMGFPTASIDVQHDKRFAGETSYSITKLLSLAGETIIAYSEKPLRLSIWIGFLCSVSAFAYGIYVIYRYFANDIPVMGWSSLIVSVFLVGGIIISLLGVLGVYLGKTFNEVKRRPLYIIRKATFDGIS
jgi:glycosyltransferase involved in cell wall biosynthesis